MHFHFDFLQGQGIYNLHRDVLIFFERAINQNDYLDGLLTQQLKLVIDDSNDLDAKFRNVFTELNKNGINKQFVYDTLINNNNIIQLLTDINYPYILFPSPSYDELLKRINALYSHLWSSTIKTNTCTVNFGGLKQHYVDHDAANLARTRRLCPFCGLRKLENPREKRNEYDHYFDKGTYPYLAVNFLNLVPMCDGCNKRPNKGTQNIIYDDFGMRRVSYFPYNLVDAFNIELFCTDLFLPTANWVVNTTSAAPDRGFASWKSIFRIDTRYRNYISDEYTFWLNSFANYWQNDLPNTVDELKVKINSYIEDVLEIDSNSEGHFLHIGFWNYFVDIPNDDLELIVDLMQEKQIYASA